MKSLIIESEKNTPYIYCNPGESKFLISGKSFPENSRKFFQPLLAWLDGFVPESEVCFDFNLDYISSSSVIAILEVLKKIETVGSKNDGGVHVRWYYDQGDDDILKIGLDYERLTTISFEFQENLN